MIFGRTKKARGREDDEEGGAGDFGERSVNRKGKRKRGKKRRVGLERCEFSLFLERGKKMGGKG